MISMAAVQLVDILGSAAMIAVAFLCVHHAGQLRRKDPQNLIWTYLLWFCLGLSLFSVSRSAGHLIKHLLYYLEKDDLWFMIRPVSGSLNTFSFVLVGSITLFFSRVFHLYKRMQEDKAALEDIRTQLLELNLNLEEMVRERTRDLSASEKKYRAVFEGSRDMLFICDKRGKLMDINPFGAELLGFSSPGAALGTDLFGFFAFPEAAAAIQKSIQENPFVKDAEVHLKARGGEEIIGLLSMARSSVPGGSTGALEGTLKDITLRKRMERQLMQADKLASLGQLAAGVAHEINNPLGMILGYAQLMLKESGREGQLANDLRIIEKHAINCKRIVEDLLKFSRSTETSKTQTSLNELLREVLDVVKAKFELENVRIEESLSDALPPLILDSDKIRQVIMNLLMNARQAIEGPGTVKVATRLDESGSRVLVQVSDTGCGIEPEILHKIFDPFFTTKPTGMGTGLGLSVSYGIAKDHDGDIAVESVPGKGSCFTLKLPVSAHSKFRTQVTGDGRI